MTASREGEYVSPSASISDFVASNAGELEFVNAGRLMEKHCLDGQTMRRSLQCILCVLRNLGG